MADALLVIGLAWWFGGTFFGTRHRLRETGSNASSLGQAAPAVLYGVGVGTAIPMLWLAYVARARIQATDGDFGLFVFGAIVCAIVSGYTLGAARA